MSISRTFQDFSIDFQDFPGLFRGPYRFPGLFQDFQDSVRTLYQNLSENVVITLLPLSIRPHNIVFTMSRYTHNLCLCSDPRNFDILWSIKPEFQRCTSAIYYFTVWGFRTLGQWYRSIVPRTKCCINILKYISNSSKFRPV